MITEQQRQRRNAGIFASDAAYIMTGKGVEVALQKMGEIEAPNLDDVPSVQLGNILEASILDAYEKIARPLALIRSPDTMLHPDLPWLGCHLDGKAVFIDQERVVEAKAFSVFDRSRWGEPGTDQVPVERLWQCMAQMAITGAKQADIPICFVNEAALVQFLTKGTVPIEIYVIPRNDELIEYMVEECGKVWQSVANKQLPAPVNVGDAELIYRRATKGKTLEADEETLGLYYALCSARTTLKNAEDKKATIESQLKAVVADAEELYSGGKLLATWKNNKDGEAFDKDAFKAAHPAIYQQFTKHKAGARPFLLKA